MLKSIIYQSRIILLLWTVYKVLGVFQTQRWLKSIGIDRGIDQIITSQTGVWICGAALILTFNLLFVRHSWFSHFTRKTILFHLVILVLFIILVPIGPSISFILWNDVDGGFFVVYQDSITQISKDAILIYIAMLSLCYGNYSYRERQKSELKSAKMREDLTKVKLDLLHSQIQPHFLFNALHNISSLMEENVKDAQNVLVSLSELLRKSLEIQETKFISLKEELSILELYLSIQSIRFSDSVEVEWNIDADFENAMVPAFILQPLVENSFKHGMGDGKLIIQIAARKVDEMLQISIQDNGVGFNEFNEGNGIINVRRRLLALYEDAGFDIESGENGTQSMLTIPLLKL